MTYFNSGNMGGPDLPQTTFGSLEDNFPPGITYARQSRRLYVGGITDEANDENIAQFFNEKMREMNFARDDKVDVQSSDPVVNIQINHEKNYAFVEVRFRRFSLSEFFLWLHSSARLKKPRLACPLMASCSKAKF